MDAEIVDEDDSDVRTDQHPAGRFGGDGRGRARTDRVPSSATGAAWTRRRARLRDAYTGVEPEDAAAAPTRTDAAAAPAAEPVRRAGRTGSCRRRGRRRRRPARGRPSALADERLDDLQRLQRGVRQLPASRVERDRDVARDQCRRRPCSRRCCRSWTTCTWPVSTATWRAGRSRPSPTSSRRPCSTRFGLARYGEPGETFDPTVHEALIHTQAELAAGNDGDHRRPDPAAGLQVPSDRVLRAARVAVADPSRDATTFRGEGRRVAGQDWFEKDFYAVLGVPVDASAGRDQEGVPQARASAPP